jgi:hypothetical protein
MSLLRAIQKAGLEAAFRAYAVPSRSSDECLAWCKARPELAGCVWPYSVRNVRAALGCQAKHGGGGRPRGKIAYSVAGRGLGKEGP